MTAPHTITTYRDGEEHGDELYVDPIIESLSYTSMYNTYDTLDPNWHEESEFRQSTFRGQSYNIDVHGMSNSHGYDINIGTAGQDYNLQAIEDYCTDNNLLLDINGIFTGGGRTITKAMVDNGATAIQIEMSMNMRESDTVCLDLQNIIDLFIQSNLDES